MYRQSVFANLKYILPVLNNRPFAVQTKSSIVPFSAILNDKLWEGMETTAENHKGLSVKELCLLHSV